MSRERVGQFDSGGRRQETPVIEMFQQRMMARRDFLRPWFPVHAMNVSPQTAAMPLAQAAPRIGCERPPSLARPPPADDSGRRAVKDAEGRPDSKNRGRPRRGKQMM